MSLPTQKHSTKTSKEQGEEVMTTQSVSMTRSKRISSTYTPPHSPNTKCAKSKAANVTNLDPTPKADPNLGPKSQEQSNINHGHHPTNNPRPEDKTKGIYNTPVPMQNVKKSPNKKICSKKGSKANLQCNCNKTSKGHSPLLQSKCQNPYKGGNHKPT